MLAVVCVSEGCVCEMRLKRAGAGWVGCVWMMRGAVGRSSAWMGSAAARHAGVAGCDNQHLHGNTCTICSNKKNHRDQAQKAHCYTTKQMKVKGETV